MWPCTLLPPARGSGIPLPACACCTPTGSKRQVPPKGDRRLGSADDGRYNELRSGLLPFRERGLIRAGVRHRAVLGVSLRRLDDPFDGVHEVSIASCLVGGGVLLVRRQGATGEKS